MSISISGKEYACSSKSLGVIEFGGEFKRALYHALCMCVILSHFF